MNNDVAYTLYIHLPNERESGDATITHFDGKYRTFFWGTGRWVSLSPDEKIDHLNKWLYSVERMLGTKVHYLDEIAIKRAVL